jgi:hypothetical protein
VPNYISVLIHYRIAARISYNFRYHFIRFIMRLSFVSAAALVSTASAHTIFQKVSVNGVDQGQLKGVRAPDSDCTPL